LVGKAVSEFAVATQVVNFNSQLVLGVELLVYLLVLGGYGLLWMRYRQSPLVAVLPKLTARIRPGPTVKLLWLAVIGVPILWLLSEFALRSVAYIVWILYANFIHKPIPAALTYDDGMQPGHIPLFCLLLLVYQVILWTQRVSPVKLMLNRIAFRGGIFGHTASDLPEHITMFCLQAIIVFTFARTIGGFLQANLNAAVIASWPEAPRALAADTNPFSLDAISASMRTIGYALSHSPHPADEDAMFSTFDFLIYNACIVGSLLGYGFSFVGYLFGKKIRNVDFTVVGWLTNAVCYQPLFALVFWQMIPPVFGLDPTVTPGFLRTATFVVAISLNVVYTLSIWNLGIMFGVMTDKGVRTTGFYSVVRHPNYTIESIMFVMFYCRALSSAVNWLAVGGFLLIYWLRSEREDQFMSVSNPDYLVYREKTPYKFIPGIY